MGVLNAESRQDLERGYGILMDLRLRHQSAEIAKGGRPHNHLDPTQLSSWDLDMLKKVLAHFAPIQARIHFDFNRQEH